MSVDELFMRRCFELARLGTGNISPNPPVGCVIVYENRIIGEGWHNQYGGPHAEVNAVLSVKPSDLRFLDESTLYVSLEPCAHYGKTPPCVDLVLKHKFPRVVISCGDPNPKVNGQSVERLRKAGVEVITGLLEEDGQWLIRVFSHSMKMKRPYVILKYAKSRDGFMGQNGKQVWINNQLSKRLSHQWRNEIDAIMVGTTTALIDNPELNNRLWFGRSPIRVVLDKKARLSPDSKIFQGEHKTIAYAEPKFINSLKSMKKIYRQLSFEDDMLEIILIELNQTDNVQSVLIEGGAKLLNSFISKGLWDEARISISSHDLGEGIKAPQIVGEIISRDNLLGDEWTIIRNRKF